MKHYGPFMQHPLTGLPWMQHYHFGTGLGHRCYRVVELKRPSFFYTRMIAKKAGRGVSVAASTWDETSYNKTYWAFMGSLRHVEAMPTWTLRRYLDLSTQYWDDLDTLCRSPNVSFATGPFRTTPRPWERDAYFASLESIDMERAFLRTRFHLETEDELSLLRSASKWACGCIAERALTYVLRYYTRGDFLRGRAFLFPRLMDDYDMRDRLAESPVRPFAREVDPYWSSLYTCVETDRSTALPLDDLTPASRYYYAAVEDRLEGYHQMVNRITVSPITLDAERLVSRLSSSDDIEVLELRV
jgi:hypothetical protein